ncbi:S8 family serine peptidase [Pseudoduganella namucuonensis]|uniref:PA domain-containing protein n=1 Tax=Pseudoduganella namucuonensis TaxID=1035707 RepID=A0A1I7IND4_9BURK|nr:S8 family serine peptidase [Pseudoduganella namucuonensis]SFU74396.1 PA domain-containing protein [Pseudoduganella namucuonensis]
MFIAKSKNAKAGAVFVMGLMAAAVGASVAAAAQPDNVRVIVAFKKGAQQNGKAAIAAAKGSIKEDLADIDAAAAEIPAKALNGLRNNPHIEFVEEDAKRRMFATSAPSTGTPYQTGQQVPYGIAMVQADQLPDTYAGNRTVCIIDSGIDLAHEDLAGNQATGHTNPGTGPWYTDENHHGTHVAGTIAAVNNGGVGVVGVNANRQLKLHIIKVFGPEEWAYTSTLIAAANKCGAAGANIISMSLGGDVPSRAEERAFDGLAKRGVLSIAAAGNDGNNAQSYPAGYASVMSVAALDENKKVADFSQFTPKVEIAAPGVQVLSTVPMGAGRDSSLKVGATSYAPGGMDGSPASTVTAPLAPFGLGDQIDASVAGKVCLIKRGALAFGVKVANCQASGGVGAVVYNNAPEGFSGTLGGTATAIPSVTASGAEGAALQGQLGQSATIAIKATNYALYNGTSMATPHVSAVAALVWSYFPACTADQIRTTLDKSAQDLGAAGRDAYYGYGLVQAKAAYDRIRAMGCAN